LRRAEHQLQLLHDRQTHRLPGDLEELEAFARRLGWSDDEVSTAAEQFSRELAIVAGRVRRILRHLFINLFPRSESGGEDNGDVETDLVLDPNPDAAVVQSVLARRRFVDPQAAYRRLRALEAEDTPFLSTTRCRHFFANLAPRLLHEVGATPDPDMTLNNLEKVTSSLGAKGVLWESLTNHPQLLRMYVQLCASSQYLCDILTSNPGMIDEVLDLLFGVRTPSVMSLRRQLRGLLKGADDVQPILIGFKNIHLLRIGIEDVLGDRGLRPTQAILSLLAEVIVDEIIRGESSRLGRSYGRPRREDGAPSEYCLLALGKFGGREMSYHSDLDLVLVYDEDGTTSSTDPGRTFAPTSNHHFYSELGRRLVETASKTSPFGRLYKIDFRLRPSGASGSLPISLSHFEEYYSTQARVWELLALTRARPMGGTRSFRLRTGATVRRIFRVRKWSNDWLAEILDMRNRLEASRSQDDLKRGAGGIVDVEFAVQMMQLKYHPGRPEILHPNLRRALRRIGESGLWPPERVRLFEEGYHFLRFMESRLGIVNNVSRLKLPDDAEGLEKLAYRLGYEGDARGQRMKSDYETWTKRIRNEYQRCFDEETRR
ncbi:MAG: bifunctional [glutamate--ammonia ligase]-adenylyl-L-tyrosine phosphorylase/[glutamate--ammonia-ligase] adenylyltransferase, partial [Planctomycetia bacterium]